MYKSFVLLACATMKTVFAFPSGTDVMILKIFSPKKIGEKIGVFAQTTASFCKNFHHNIVFKRKTAFFSAKILIITARISNDL
jgi:hypothetical protein